MGKKGEITVEELVELKTKLEKDINEYLSAKLYDFQQKTGVPVTYVNASLLPKWIIGAKKIAVDVKVEVDIDRVGEI